MSERDNSPRWDGRRGHYEAWFLTMSLPQHAAGYWIRYTVRAPIAGPAERRVWFARFDRREPARTFGVNDLPAGDVGRGPSFGVGDCVLGSGEARGEVSGAGHLARWDLSWDVGDPTFRLLPPAFYRGGLAPTKPYTPNPDVRFRGTIEVDGERTELDGVPGQQGHLYGRRHAERWAWAFCNAFEENGFAFQALSAQTRRGPFLTPFLTFAGLRIDGRWVRFRGVGRRKTWGLGLWRLALVAKEFRLEGEVRAPKEAMVQARYLDPDDTPRWCHNSEVASARLLLWERGAGGWQEVAELTSDGTTHAEWAGRTPAPGSFAVHREVA